MSPLIMCKKCGDAVNDIQVHECLPDMQVGVVPEPVTVSEPYPVAEQVPQQPQRTSTQVFANLRKKFETKIGIERIPKDLCICNHSKYHHEFDDIQEKFTFCNKCDCGMYSQKEGGVLL